tara:strand:- start:411 stop:1751 length:1341 start_codon:yes stop_codon:yes gene_type:complete
MILNKSFLKVLVIVLVTVSFFLGYFFRENAAGGGAEFYELSWPIIQSFKEDFIYTLKNYGSFRDFTIPFSHIINSYLNPFSNDIAQFQLSVTIISFFIFVIFYLILKKIFPYVEKFDAMLLSSVILLLPFFRTSAFWGKNENYGWLFFILALYYFSKIKKDITDSKTNISTLNIVLFCFTSACALYARQALAFLPISYFLYLYFNNANKKIIYTSIIYFFIFAIPSLLLIFFWGNVFELKSTDHPFFSWWIHPRNLLKNVPILLSFFAFYLIPILAIELFEKGYENFLKKYLKNFLFAFIVLFSLSLFGLLDYLSEYSRAGGAILKVNYLIQKNNFLLLLLFSAIGFSILISFFKENKKNNITFLIPLLVIYCFPNLLYQEYAEPLILIIFFLALKTDLHRVYFKNTSFSNLILLSYFTIYLAGSIYFKHIAFKSYEEWKIFLGIY